MNLTSGGREVMRRRNEKKRGVDLISERRKGEGKERKRRERK